MRSNWWLDLSIILSVLLHIGILAAILYRHTARRWPSLLTYSLFTIGLQAALYIQRPVYRHFFWTYWISYAILAAFRLWIIADIFRAIPGVMYIPRAVKLAVWVLGLFMAAGAWQLVNLTAPSIGSHVQQAAMLFGRAVNIATVALMIALLAAFKVTGMGWTRQAAHISIGLALRVAIGYVTNSMLQINSKPLHLVGNAINSYGDVLTVAIWMAALCASDKTFSLTADEVNFYERFLSILPRRHTPQRETSR